MVEGILQQKSSGFMQAHKVTYTRKLHHCSSCQYTHGCGALASWAARRTTVCLDTFAKLSTLLSILSLTAIT